MLKSKRQSRSKAEAPSARPPTPLGVALLLILVVTIAAPALTLATFAPMADRLLFWVQTGVAVVYATTSLMILWEAVVALRPPTDASSPPPAARELPGCTAIVAAYLPNEQDIIVETLLHLLSEVEAPADRYQVILAYNTPRALPVEKELQRLAAADPRLLVLPVAGSRSKAENVNGAIEAATGEIVAIFDADHWPAPDCFRRAWRWIKDGADMVQGRCVIRNEAHSWMTRLIAVEFDVMYACSHQGRARLSGSGIFGGSNAYWRREALTQVRLDSSMLTEDIDASVRALLAGQNLVHDREIVSHELAPIRAAHWYTQRKRWSQGWFEVSLKHGAAVMRSPVLTVREKILWWYLLCWRELFPILSLQFFSLMLAAYVLQERIDWFAPGFFLGTSVLNLSAGAVVVALTRVCCRTDRRAGHGPWYLAYALLGLAYTTVKTLVMLLAQYSHLSQEHAWVATPRGAEGPTGMVVDLAEKPGTTSNASPVPAGTQESIHPICAPAVPETQIDRSKIHI